MNEEEVAKALVRLRQGPGMTHEQVGDELELLRFIGAADVAEATATINAAIKQVRPARPRAAVHNALIPQFVREGELRNLTARRNRFLEGEKRIQDRQLRNYENNGTVKLVKILMDLAKARKEETVQDRVSGLWVKVTDRGRSFIVEFHDDGTLTERSLFKADRPWGGKWQVDGSIVEIAIGPYASVYTFAGEKRLSGSEQQTKDDDAQADSKQVMMFKLV